MPEELLEAQPATPATDTAPPSDPPPETSSRRTAYRWVDRQVLLPAVGPAETYYDFQVVLGSQADLENWGIWEIPFQPSYHTFTLHHLEVLRGGAWSDRLAASRLSVIQREDDLRRLIYDQNQTLVALIGDLRVGDTLRIAYTLRGSNPVYGGRYSSDFGLTASIPVEHERLRLRSAPGRTLQAQIHRGGEVFAALHGEDEAAEDEASASRELEAPESPSDTLPRARTLDVDGWQEIHWHGRDIEPAESEWNEPAGWFSLPTLTVSEFRDWSEVAAWSIPLYRPGTTPPELAQVARQIARRTTDPGARLVAARDWVQQEIRYFALAVDEHTHQPYDLRQVLARRYGDCKDKTTLLLALLRELGIEAWPAFVHSERRASIARDLPSPRVFDHVVAVAEIDGESVWIDATLSQQGGQGPDDVYIPDYGLALESRPKVAGLTALPDTAGGPGASRHRYAYRVPNGGAASAVIESEFTGYLAEQQRRTLQTTTEEELAEQYVEYYTMDQGSITQTADLEIEDSRSANRIEIRESYELRRPQDNDISFETLVLLVGSDLPRPDPGERAAPYALPHPLHRIEEVEISAELQGPFEAVEETIDNPWFRYTARSTEVPDGIRLTYELETRADRVPAADLDRYRKDVDRLSGSLGYQIHREPELFEGEWWSDHSDRGKLIFVSGATALVMIALLLFGVGVWFAFRRG
ncbi:MAG: DUF3857 domain-containing protein [Acidobacteriota bacterium]